MRPSLSARISRRSFRMMLCQSPSVLVAARQPNSSSSRPARTDARIRPILLAMVRQRLGDHAGNEIVAGLVHVPHLVERARLVGGGESVVAVECGEAALAGAAEQALRQPALFGRELG